MKILNVLILNLFFHSLLIAQICNTNTYLESNELKVAIRNDGGLFSINKLDGLQEYQAFYANWLQGAPVNAINYTGLAIGALDEESNIVGSFPEFGSEAKVYMPGFLDENGMSLENNCANWNKIWRIERAEILAHLIDFQDGIIDTPLERIYTWPAKGNPHFLAWTGFDLPAVTYDLAPFFDANDDEIYDPNFGDFPLPIGVSDNTIPQQILWCVYNDIGNPYNDKAAGLEVHQTYYNFFCGDDSPLNQTIFGSYRIHNKKENYTDTRIALLLNPGLGNFQDDLFGCSPVDNAIFMYNSDNEDEENTNNAHFGENPPAMSMTYLNQSLDKFMFAEVSTGINYRHLSNDISAHYQFMNGNWLDDMPLTEGEMGYQSGALTDFIFPDNPNDTNGWSLHQIEHDLNTNSGKLLYPSTFVGAFNVGDTYQLDVAFSVHQETGNNYLQNVNLFYEEVVEIQHLYDHQFIESCDQEWLNCSEDCFWPGDANADGIANYEDLLMIGAHWTEIFVPNNTVPVWLAQDAPDWPLKPENPLNPKHADCDGNGLIDIQDFEITALNYDKKRVTFEPNFENSEGNDFKIITQSDLDAVQPGQVVAFEIELSEAAPSTIHGLSFRLAYDSSYFEKVEFTGFACNELCAGFALDKVTATSKQAIEFAITRLPNDYFLEIGRPFALFHLRAKAAFTDSLSSAKTYLRFQNVKALDNNGVPIEIGADKIPITVLNVPILATNKADMGDFIRVYPNPNKGLFTIESTYEMVKIRLFDQAGKIVLEKNVEGKSNSFLLEKRVGGIYILEVSAREGFRNYKRLVIH